MHYVWHIKHLFTTGDHKFTIFILLQTLTYVFELQVVKVDLFGSSSDEKEVTKIAGKTVEARGNKSYNTLHIAAEFVTEKCLINIIMPFKDVRIIVYSIINGINNVSFYFVLI